MTIAIIVGGVVTVAILAIVIGGELLSTQLDERVKLEREQRLREDRERDYLKDIENRNFWTDAVASAFDPIGLFH